MEYHKGMKNQSTSSQCFALIHNLMFQTSGIPLNTVCLVKEPMMFWKPMEHHKVCLKSMRSVTAMGSFDTQLTFLILLLTKITKDSSLISLSDSKFRKCPLWSLERQEGFQCRCQKMLLY